jgi:hypothetical protein
VVSNQHTEPQEIDMPDLDRLNEHRSAEEDDRMYEKYFPPRGNSIPVSPVRHPWLEGKVTYCGITKRLKEWVRESGLRQETVRARLARKMDPVAALTTPDRDGHCLKPLDAEYLESHRKTQQKARSGAKSISCGDDCTHVAGIMAYGRKIFLGTHNTRAEAVFAFNRAVDLLPGEYEASDKYEADGEALDPTTRVRIENAVRLIFEAHGLPGEPEPEQAAE